MTRKIVFILSLLLLATLGFSCQIQASEASSYVIFRANVAPMYIKNMSAPVQVLAIPFNNNKPVYATVQVHISIRGLNVNYSFDSTYNIQTGQAQNIYLPAMAEGHYDITLYAEHSGVRSRVVEQDFAVVPAPHPYKLYFNNDGSEIHFESKVLNDTGQIDPNVTFRLEIYLWNGAQQSLVATYDNVTKIDIDVPDSWKTGILIVDVVDQYGWRNGMSINLAKFQFQGYPVQYDYYQTHRYPAAGRSWLWYLAVVGMALALLYIGKKVLEHGGES